ncbi:MAG: ribose-phosphate pyrophosphokinase [Pseudomonadales bacterium]|nr:ribose-phosphate pyrophosphokinase [Pseudomonadales bacterium]
MSYLYFSLQQHHPLWLGLAENASAREGKLSYRRFPDGETYLQVLSDCQDQDVIVLHTLNQPDEDILGLLFLATALKQQGAKRVGLVAPYLSYMRQDKAFKEGELITSRVFANLVSQHFDWLLTVDPHLHRYKALEEIYPIPCVTLHAAPLLHRWIKNTIQKPLLIGPDSESAQWVEQAAQDYGMPYLVLEKQRQGDREVLISLPDVAQWREHTPVLVDDIVSSGRTLLATIALLQDAGFSRCSCVAIHGIFAENSYEEIRAAGADMFTTNTIPHRSNKIDLNHLMINAIDDFMEL